MILLMNYLKAKILLTFIALAIFSANLAFAENHSSKFLVEPGQNWELIQQESLRIRVLAKAVSMQREGYSKQIADELNDFLKKRSIKRSSENLANDEGITKFIDTYFHETMVVHAVVKLLLVETQHISGQNEVILSCVIQPLVGCRKFVEGIEASSNRQAELFLRAKEDTQNQTGYAPAQPEIERLFSILLKSQDDSLKLVKRSASFLKELDFDE